MRYSGEFLRISDDDLNGELPHHFEKDKPTYTALSGAIQTGVLLISQIGLLCVFGGTTRQLSFPV